MYGKEEKKGRRKLKIRGKALAKCKGKQKKMGGVDCISNCGNDIIY